MSISNVNDPSPAPDVEKIQTETPPHAHDINVIDSAQEEINSRLSLSAEKVVNDSNESLPLTDTSKDPPPISSLTMPSLTTNVANITLHSPSQIVGTPFAITSPPFEYPFPDTSTTTSPSLTSSPADLINSVSTSLPTSSSMLGRLSPMDSASQPHLPLTNNLNLNLNLNFSNNPTPHMTHYPHSFPPPPELSHYSLTHPKMRDAAGRDPPVPPGIVKRRQRWSLGLLGRKKSNRESKKVDVVAASGGGGSGSGDGGDGTTVIATSTSTSPVVSDEHEHEQGPERHSGGPSHVEEDSMLTTTAVPAATVVSETTSV